MDKETCLKKMSFHDRIVKALKPMYVGSKAFNKDKIIDAMRRYSLAFADVITNHNAPDTTLLVIDIGELQVTLKLTWGRNDTGMFKLMEIV